jgi:hypothetical protein
VDGLRELIEPQTYVECSSRLRDNLRYQFGLKWRSEFCQIRSNTFPKLL